MHPLRRIWRSSTICSLTRRRRDREDVRAELVALEGKEPLLASYAKGERAAIAGKWSGSEHSARGGRGEPSFPLGH